MDLQTSTQVSALSAAFDGYMLMVLIIMVVAGVLGGVANFFLSERHGELRPRDVVKYAVLGVIAALTVPLFLNMLSSNLLEAARVRPVDLFVFSGFCLLYVVASRRLFEGAANRLLAQLNEVRRDVNQLRRDKLVSAAMPQPAEREVTAAPVVEPAIRPEARPEPVRESISYNDVEILRALAEESTVYGNLSALADKTGLGRDLISARLAVLKSLGVIETRINDKNVLHWFVSGRGKQMLSEILSGQNERKTA